MFCERGVDGRERLAQRGVERADGAVAFGGGVQHLRADAQLDHGLGEGLAVAGACRPATW